MDSQLVWTPDPYEGYVLGRVVDIGAGNLANIRLEPSSSSGAFNIKQPKQQQQQLNKIKNSNRIVECPIDQVFAAENDHTKDYDDNCKCCSL